MKLAESLADKIDAMVREHGLDGLNAELRVRGLRVSMMPFRDPAACVTESEISDLLWTALAGTYHELRVMADDMSEDMCHGSGMLNFTWRCERGVYRFSAVGERSKRPALGDHRVFVAQARWVRNDPEGYTIYRPPYAIFVGERPFIYVLHREAPGRWAPPADAWTKVMKEMLLRDLKGPDVVGV